MEKQEIALHTRIIHWLKILLLVGIVVIGGLLILWPFLYPDEAQLSFSFTTKMDGIVPLVKPHMENPLFQGVDNKLRPYRLTASQAVQENADLILLDDVNAEFGMDGDDWLVLSASRGRLFIKKQQLTVEGSVTLFTGDGMQIETKSATLHVPESILVGKTPVIIQKEEGVLHAKGFNINQNTRIIDFTGPIKMTLYPGVME